MWDTMPLTVEDKEGNEVLDAKGDLVGEVEMEEEGDSEGY